jgi:hypothetical protein
MATSAPENTVTQVQESVAPKATVVTVPQKNDSVTVFLNASDANKKSMANQIMKEQEKRGAAIDIPAIQDEGRAVFRINSELTKVRQGIEEGRAGSESVKALKKEADRLEAQMDYVKRRCKSFVDILETLYPGSNTALDAKRYYKSSGCE